MCLARAIRAALLVPVMTLVVVVPGRAIAATRDGPPPLFADLAASFAPLQSRRAALGRERLVHVNFDLLLDSHASPRLPLRTLRLNLFADVALDAALTEVSKSGAASHAWVGRVAGADPSEVVLVVSGGVLAGRVAVPGATYQVRYAGGGLHAVQQILPSAFPPEGPPLQPPLIPGIGREALAAAAVDDGQRIDVLVAYTPAARMAAGGTAAIQAEIELAIATTNLTYANSGVIQRVRLVHTHEVEYAEAGDMNADLARLQNPFDGLMDEVHPLRDAYGADVVSLIVETGNFCGLAYLQSVVSPEFAVAAFSTVLRVCAAGNLTFAHELGHNMGAHHDWFVAGDFGAFPYSHGYVNTAARWRTVMAYNDACFVLGFGCTRLAHWSNPSITLEGAPMGVPEGAPRPADNRKTLNNTAFTVANFRPTMVPPSPEALGIVTGGLAYNFDQVGRGFARVMGEFGLSEPLDLGAPGIHASILSLLLEGGGREMVEVVPLTLAPRTRSPRVTVFETPPGTTPLVRLTIRTCIPTLEGCPSSRGLAAGDYSIQIETVNALVHAPTQCGPAPGPGTTTITTRFMLADGTHPPVGVLIRDWPWTCGFQSSRPILIRPQH